MTARQWRWHVVMLVLVALAAPAYADDDEVERLSGQPRTKSKVKNIHELDENAPHDVSGKVQFVPNAKLAAQMKAHERQQKAAEEAEKREAAAAARADAAEAKRRERAEAAQEKREAKAGKA